MAPLSRSRRRSWCSSRGCPSSPLLPPPSSAPMGQPQVNYTGPANYT
jgi:hypothetical protein